MIKPPENRNLASFLLWLGYSFLPASCAYFSEHSGAGRCIVPACLCGRCCGNWNVSVPGSFLHVAPQLSLLWLSLCLFCADRGPFACLSAVPSWGCECTVCFSSLAYPKDGQLHKIQLPCYPDFLTWPNPPSPENQYLGSLLGRSL